MSTASTRTDDVDAGEVEQTLEPPGRGTKAQRGGFDRGYWLERVGGYVSLLALWWFASNYLVAGFILPPPTEVFGRMLDFAVTGDLWEHASFTFQRIFIAFAVTLVIGTAIGVLMGMSSWFDGFFRDYLLISFTTPGLIYVLVALMIFGLGLIGPLVAIVLCSIPYVAINVWEGVRAVPKDLLDMASSFKMSRMLRIRHIVIPSISPYLFQGMRFGFAITWKIAMLAEVFAASEGIGYQMRIAHRSFQMQDLIGWALWFFVAAIILERLVLQRLINRSLRWRPNTAGGAA